MEMLLVPVPLFDKYMSVEAYLLRYCFTNQNVRFTPETESPLLNALEECSVEAIAGGNRVFVPITVRLIPELLANFSQTPQITTLLLHGDFSTPMEQPHLDNLAALKRKGYSIAVTQSDKFVDDDKLVKLCDFALFDSEAMFGSDRRAHVIRYRRLRKTLQAVATGLQSNDEFEKADRDSFHLFEGPFYRIPITRKDRELSPIKANLIQLLNMVRDENFEFREIAEVVRRDPALSYSLMRFINSPYLGIKHKVKSIQQAVTLLGQVEVRKWVTAAVFKALGSDRPSELTRISLVRAKFAEDLADAYGLVEESASLFMTGLFSALDVMLDNSMEDALARVMVSDDIAGALIRSEGPYYPVLEFVKDYESADWPKVISHSMLHGLSVPRIYRAYLNAVGWYHELITTRVPAMDRPRGPIAPSRSL